MKNSNKSGFRIRDPYDTPNQEKNYSENINKTFDKDNDYISDYLPQVEEAPLVEDKITSAFKINRNLHTTNNVFKASKKVLETEDKISTREYVSDNAENFMKLDENKDKTGKQ